MVSRCFLVTCVRRESKMKLVQSLTWFAALAFVCLSACNSQSASTAEPESHKGTAAASVGSKIVGFWQSDIDEESVRKRLEETGRSAQFLVINGGIVKDPTPAQREEYIKQISTILPDQLKRKREDT